MVVILGLSCLNCNLCIAEMSANPSIQPSPVVYQVDANDNKTIEELRNEVKHKGTLSPVSVFANLFTLIIIMLALAWLYNKYGKNTLSKVLATTNLNKNTINILSTTPIGQNKYLHVVEVAGEKILIGATNSNISFLKEIKSDISQEKAVSDE